MPKVNIITQLTLFFAFAILINFMNLKGLLQAFVLLILACVLMKNQRFYRLSKRLKWFYLVMFVIFAFNTPGEHIRGWFFSVSPTYEGLYEGFLQLMRVNVMLGALSILLTSNTRQQLISGFYYLFVPLKHLKLDVERFTARLWLTLHYVETQEQVPKSVNNITHFGERLADIFHEKQHDEVEIVLEKPQFSLLDYAVLLLTLAWVVHAIKAAI